jgi:hypothetical protein
MKNVNTLSVSQLKGAPGPSVLSSFLQGLTLLLCLVFLPSVAKSATDYSIYLDGTTLVLSDQMGDNDVVFLSAGGGFTLEINVPGRDYSLNGSGPLNFPVYIPLAGIENITIHTGEGDDVINVGAFSNALPFLSLSGGRQNDIININGNLTFQSGAGLDIDLQNDDPVHGNDRIVFAANVNVLLFGDGEAVLKSSQGILFDFQSTLQTVDGDLTIEGNIQPNPATGNFKGVELVAATVQILGDGYLTVKGRGGNNAAGFQTGVSLTSGARLIGGTIHEANIQGWGGAGSGARNYGVLVENNSSINSLGAMVTVTGQGNGSGASSSSIGVMVASQGLITAGGVADVILEGNGCTNCSGANNMGVNLETNSTITGNGEVIVTGNGGGTASSNSNMGVHLIGTSAIRATGAGDLSVTGVAGQGSGGNLRGVMINGLCSIGNNGSGNTTVKGTGRESTGNLNVGVYNSGLISAAQGDVKVTGFGGGTGASNNNYGVLVLNAGIPAQIWSGGGNVSVTGNGAYDANGIANHGVFVSGNLSWISTSNGNIEVTGKGGGTNTSGNNVGVFVQNQGFIQSGGTGTIRVDGTGGKGSASGNRGVYVDAGGFINATNGDVTVTGKGVGTGASALAEGITVSSSTANYSYIANSLGGNITLDGTGGATTGNENYGIQVGNNGRVTTGDGDITMTGKGGGSGPASLGIGILVRLTGQVIAKGSGALTMRGTGGPGVGGNNIGVSVSGTAIVSSEDGNIQITGIEGTGTASNGIVTANTATITSQSNITLIANSVVIGTSSNIITGADQTVTIRPLTNGVAINLGPTGDPLGGPLQLTDAELDRVIAGTLVIGHGQSGTITQSQPITRPAQTDVYLHSSGSIFVNASSINTAGGLLTFHAAQGVFPAAVGVDVQVGTVAFATGTTLMIQINGLVPDVNYSQLNVQGEVDLNGARLSISGSFIQPQCNQVVIIRNDGTDPVIGTFDGMPEGFIITNYLGSGKNVGISYVGGDGNDVVLIERVIPVISCPNNIVSGNAPGICGKDIPVIGSPNVADNCQFNLTNDAPGFYQIGVTEVTWVVTDVNGNSASCVQTITINDTEYPTVVCPNKIETVNQIDQDCGAQIFFDLPAGDNCPGFILDQTHFSGDVFPIGITDVEVSITDAAGNTNYCTFKIVVDPREEVCNGIDDDCDGYTDELQDWELNTTVYANDAAANRRMGESVDLKGIWGIAGSSRNNNGVEVGTAYILYYDSNTGEWRQVAQLFPDNFSAGDQRFGAKVAMGNGFCAVSAPLDDEGGADAGATYIYSWNGGNPSDWVLHQKILGASAGEQSGSALDFNNEWLIVGASLNSDGLAGAGAAYLYVQAPAGMGNWNLVKKLSSQDADLGDRFGFDVAISGSYALVSANLDDEKGVDAGAAYIFARNQGGADNWGQLKKLTASDGQTEDNFGVSVDIDGPYAVVGANRDDDKGNESGSAYMYYKNQGGVADSWNQHTKIVDYNGKKGEHFGYAVSIDGDHIAIGARWKKVFQSRAGAVFVYHREDSGWAEFAMLNEPNNFYNDNLGSSVAINGQYLMAGIPGEDLPGITDCGAVLVFNAVCGDSNRPSRFRDQAEVVAPEMTMEAFPVPFDQTLMIKLDNAPEENVLVQVFDLLGRPVATLFNGRMEGGQTLLWQAGDVPSGAYLIRVSTEQKTLTQTVVRN